jgi:D-methionine transport system ATP-binding protein
VPGNVIELKDISIEFRTQEQVVRAVDAVSLHIRAGEVFGIVGASGAGKSSLLRTINLLERPSAGRVRLDGKDITDLKGPALRRERQKTGMIFQHFNLMHTRTVFDNVAFALRVARRRAADIATRVPEILNLVGLDDKVRAYPSQLSGGQKQRVGIARAIANHPAVLLCDEPTSALDLENAAAILELLKEINRYLGITIVLICHEMGVIKQSCSRVAVMDSGRVVEQGDVYGIFARP